MAQNRQQSATGTFADTGTSMLLRASELSLARADSVVIQSLDLILHRGEAIHLLGPNGAGKSTLLAALAGLLTPVSGALLHMTPATGYLGHDNGLLPDLSVAQNLALYANCGLSAEATTIEQLGLPALSARLARTLSQGQARRISLALACRPEAAVWLLDEPFSGLDQAAVQTALNLFNKHLQRGGAIVFSSHDHSLPGAHRLTLGNAGIHPEATGDV